MADKVTTTSTLQIASKTWAKINPYSFGFGMYIGQLIWSGVAQ